MTKNIGLTKEQIRRIVLSKVKIVYRDWRSKESPFSNRRRSGNRRNAPQAFETALVASLLGGLSEAMEKNNRVLASALGHAARSPRAKAQAKRRKR